MTRSVLTHKALETIQQINYLLRLPSLSNESDVEVAVTLERAGDVIGELLNAIEKPRQASRCAGAGCCGGRR